MNEAIRNSLVYHIDDDGTVKLWGWLILKDGEDGTLSTNINWAIPKGYDVWGGLPYNDFIKRAEPGGTGGSLILDENGVLMRFRHEET